MDLSSLPTLGARKSLDLGAVSRHERLSASGTTNSATGVANALLENFRATLGEAESYAALYEARVKVEEDYVRALKAIVDKQREMDLKVDHKLASVGAIPPSPAELPGLRRAWREMRENDLRELDTRAHMIESLRHAVIAPLIAFRDAQERIRKRVKEDLKTSSHDYDEMRNVTLPRAKKNYEKKCDEMEQLRLQAQAVEDQRALLSPPAVQREREPSMDSHRASASSHHSPDSSTSAPGGEGEESSSSGAQPIGIPSSSHPRKSHDRSQSGGSLRSLVGSRPGTPKGPSEGFGPGSLPRNEGGFSSSGASSGQMAGSPPTAGDKEKGRENFFSALRSKEGWDAARKEAPKKLNALISRMREGATSERGGSSGLMPSGNASSGGSGGTSPSGGITPLPNDGAVTPHSGAMLGGGPGTLRSAQNIALKSVKAKREAGEADTAYRKAVFDLETLRIRREKTMAAAEASVLECQRELALTAQAIWLQAERVAIVCNGAAVSLHEHAESVVVKCIDNLDTELANSLGRLPSTRSEDLDERPVPYVNYFYGECKDLIFGVNLTDYAFSHGTSGSGATPAPPLIVTKCVNFIETRALQQPGIYRISAKHSAIQALAHALEKDEARFQFDPSRDEPAAVAGVLKMHLRQLPDPVMAIPFEERIRYTHERDEHMRTGFATLKGRIRRLPPIHQATLKAVVEHLSKVAANSEHNKMDAKNLAVVFGPVLLSEADHETTSIAAAMEEDRTMEDMIQYCDIMFELNTAGPAIPLSGAGGGPGVAVSTPPIVTGPTSLKRSNAIGTGAIGTSTSHAPTLTLPEQQEISDFALQWPEQKGNSAHVKSLSDSIAQPESERLDVPLSPGAFSDSAAGEGEHEHERTAQPALSRLDTEMRAGRRTAGAAPALDVAGANNHTNQLSVSNGGDESETRRSSLNAEVWKDVGPLYLAASSAALAPSMPSPSPSSVSSVNASPGHPTPTRTDVTAAPFTQLRADRMGQTQLP